MDSILDEVNELGRYLSPELLQSTELTELLNAKKPLKPDLYSLLNKARNSYIHSELVNKAKQYSLNELINGLNNHKDSVLNKYEVAFEGERIKVPYYKALMGSLNDLLGEPVFHCLHEEVSVPPKYDSKFKRFYYKLGYKLSKLLVPEKRRHFIMSFLATIGGCANLGLTASSLFAPWWYDYSKYISNSVGKTFFWSQALSVGGDLAINSYCSYKLKGEYDKLCKVRDELLILSDEITDYEPFLDDLLSERKSVRYRSKVLSVISAVTNSLKAGWASWGVYNSENALNFLINSSSSLTNSFLAGYEGLNAYRYSFEINDLLSGHLRLYSVNSRKDLFLQKFFLAGSVIQSLLMAGTYLNNSSTILDPGFIAQIVFLCTNAFMQFQMIRSITKPKVNVDTLSKIDLV